MRTANVERSDHHRKISLTVMTVLIAILGAALTGLVTAPASASTTASCNPAAGHQCAAGIGDDYPRKNLPMDVGSGYGGLTRECVDFAAWRLNRDGAPGWYNWGNGNQWDDTARAKGVRVDHIPAIGAVAQWEANHVAIVSGFNADHSQIFIEEYNRDYNGTYGSRWIPAGAPSNFLHVHDTGGSVGPITEGSFVSYGGTVYRIAGGAPIAVSSWNVYGGVQPTRPLSDPEFASLRAVPADGTFIGEVGGTVYRIAGGAPIAVSDWAIYGGVQPTVMIDKAAVDNAGGPGAWSHLRAVPVDNTFIGEVNGGTVYRIAGGAPIAVSNWNVYGGVQPTVMVDKSAVDHAGQTGPWSHLRAVPADGTFIRGRQSAKVFRVAGGVPTYVPSWAPYGGPKPYVDVDQVAVDRAGQPGVWSHLKAAPAAPKPPASPGAGKAPVGGTTNNPARSCRVFRATWHGHRAKIKKCTTGKWTPTKIKAGKKAALKRVKSAR